MIFFNRSSTEFGIISKNDISDEVFLFPSERNRLKKIKHPARRTEFIGVRQLRNKMIPDHEIVYLASGKPTLKKVFYTFQYPTLSKAFVWVYRNQISVWTLRSRRIEF